jgi:hypothetical protein
MLHVHKVNSNTICFRVEGTMGPEEAHGLNCAWTDSAELREGKTCIVDLSAVTHFDHSSGVPIVRRLIRDGARIKAPIYAIHCLIEVVCDEQHRALQQGDRSFRASLFTGDYKCELPDG